MTTFGPKEQTAFVNASEVYPEDAKDMSDKLNFTNALIANAINIREISLYQEANQLVTGQQFSTPGDNNTFRYSFRQLFYFGAIAPGATLTIAHGITGIVLVTAWKGGIVTNVVDFRPLPYVDEILVTNQVSVKVDATNIYIGNGATAPAITSGDVTIEYLLN